MKVSVQICSYNRKNILKRCLERIFFQDFHPDDYEVILVDDGSTDGTKDMVGQLKPNCDFNYFYQSNKGLASARNHGISKARGEIILFIDDDILASPQLVREHYDFHKSHLKSVVKGWVNHVSNLENITKPCFNWADFSTAFFWTSNVSVKKEHLIQAGAFDEDFEEYGWEDLELGLRLKKIGLKSYFNKKAVVYHYKKEMTCQSLENSFNVARAKGRTAVLFYKKNPTLRVKIATGDYFMRFLLNDFFYLKGLGKKFFQRVVESKEGKLRGFSLFCAKKLIDFHYFQALREAKRTRK